MVRFARGQVQVVSEDSKAKWGSILWRVACIFAVAVFLMSIFNPFLGVNWGGLEISDYFSTWPGEMWSFKQNFVYLDISGPAAFAYVERSFVQYWLQNWNIGVASWTGYALMAMFLLQALTIASGVVAMSKNSRVPMFLSITSNTLIVVLMSTISWCMDGRYARRLLSGFWFTLLSIPIFIFVVVVYCHFVHKF